MYIHIYAEALAGAAVMPLVYVVSLGRYDGSLGFNTTTTNNNNNNNDNTNDSISDRQYKIAYNSQY